MNKSGKTLQEVFGLSLDREDRLIQFITTMVFLQQMQNKYAPGEIIEQIKEECETEDELTYSLIMLGISMA